METNCPECKKVMTKGHMWREHPPKSIEAWLKNRLNPPETYAKSENLGKPMQKADDIPF